VRFDDRLRTVMMQPVADAHDRTVRWRQLVDLLSRPHDEIDAALLDAALTMVQSGMRTIPKAVRAATARSIAGRAAEPRLIAIFASDKLEVAAPLLAAAPLDDAGWATVLAAASEEVSAFLGTLRSEVPKAPEPPVAAAEGQDLEQGPSIGEMVARIERLKSKRETIPSPEFPEFQHAQPATDDGRALIPGSSTLFRWECDASGQISWVEGAPRGALIGRSLPAEDGAPRELVRAFTDRLPFEGTSVRLPTPALEGEWRLSGFPAFSPTDGRFMGYRGTARREGVEEEPRRLERPAAVADAETLRETVHEIKTPLNAIIGFAEIIDGQYLGPAHRNYRSRAAEIAAQARMLLAAIEDLDLAARIQVGGQGQVAPAELAEVLPPIAEELGNRALARDVKLRIVTSLGALRCGVEPDLARRMIRRLIGAAVDAAPDGQLVEVDVKEAKRRITLSVTRPLSTRHLGDAQIMDPAFVAEGTEASQLGLGFALRLVRGLARLAGGDLQLTTSEFQLVLPAGRN
jgi:signal transduction histidine kinase